MNIPNPNSENIYVFDNYEKFAEAVERFVRGVNVFWKHGTTYDMMTRYENNALVGAKYTVDASGETSTGGDYDIVITKNGADGAAVLEKGTYAELYNKLYNGQPVTGVYKFINAGGIEQKIVQLSGFFYYISSGSIFLYGTYAYYNGVTYLVTADLSADDTVTINDRKYPA